MMIKLGVHINREFLDHLHDCQVLKEGSVPCSCFVVSQSVCNLLVKTGHVCVVTSLQVCTSSSLE